MAITATITGGDVQLSGNPVEIECTGGSAPAGSYDYKILLKIISEDSKLFGAPFTDAITPDSTGKAIFDISGLVDQPVDVDFEFPVASPFVEYPTQAFNIQVQPGESYFNSDGIQQESWGAVSDIFQILKGGFSPRQFALMFDGDTNFYETYIAGGKFLTPRPWGDFVHPAQPIKLWYMVPENKTAYYKVKAVFSDKSEEIYTYPSLISLKKDYLYEFNCNPANLGIEIEIETSKVLYFDVWLESSGSAISDVRRFQYDWKYCERPFFILFANSLGGIDDIYLGGYAKEGLKISGEVFYKPQQRGDSVKIPTLVTPDRKAQNVWDINSGYKNATQMLFMRDLLVAKQVWLLYPSNFLTYYFIVPVLVSNSEEVLVDRIENLYSINLQLEEAHESKFTFDNRIW